MADDNEDEVVATLKRELEALRLQLQLERRAVQGGGNADTKQEPKLEQEGATSESAGPKRRGGDKNAVPSSKAPRVYVQHAAAGARRGKWWLRDRQVLSRATPDEDGSATLKVRETWVWLGRTVILDKIMRVDAEKQEEEVEPDRTPASPAAAQPSGAAETAGGGAVAEEVPPTPSAKADDEVRESSPPVVKPSGECSEPDM
ncbi:hypothetical protein PHYPSEUDO_004322 [Phytophthora pseudosyringae]|uniref:Uncharacterized protein n=1 Tax=Phytophthora pseudosyringae TaxID=221518 RepID=A0A8T1VTJ5_9STRA|nr:hypothetical protein PHYPSEUDO_004322 [Phytophthora pseudosyringae]